MVAGLIQPPSWIATVVGVWHQNPVLFAERFALSRWAVIF
jgi:hypothetical protein